MVTSTELSGTGTKKGEITLLFLQYKHPQL